MKGIFPYFDAEYSFCNYKYEEYTPDMRTQLAFGLHDDNIISLSNLEIYEKIELNTEGGKCKTIEKLSNILEKEVQTKRGR